MSRGDPIPTTASVLRTFKGLKSWLVTSVGDGHGFWSVYEPRDRTGQPETGFKIHVSASIYSAGEVLARTIPILVRLGVPFKHAATLEQLAFLSNGSGGQSQVGKFMTAYPPDVGTARELARLLHKATDGLHGPQIPGEPSLFPGSLVHYRYGSFSPHWLQLPTGRIVPARMGPGGLEVDTRGERKPGPLDADGSSLGGPGDEAKHSTRVIRDKYIRVQHIYESPKGCTWFGFDRNARDDGLVIIKEAYAYVMEGTDGLDARQRLRREAECLRNLVSTGLTPVIEEYWEEHRSAFLVYRPMPGPTFASVLNALAAEGLHPTSDLLRQWMGALSTAVAVVHQHGYVIGDIKPQNLIFTGEFFHFIDLELAGPPTDEPTGSMGTRGYCSPQQSDPRSGRSYLDDVYAIGATMIAAATLTDAASLPDCNAVAQAEATYGSPNDILAVIQRCLAPEPHDRFPSAHAVAEQCCKPTALVSGEHIRRGEMDAPDFIQLASEIGDAILRDAILDNDKAWWVSHHPTIQGNPGRDLYAGSAGTALFLCALYDETKVARYLDIAIRCGLWLWNTKPIVARQVEMPGLYFGDCGPGLLYLRLFVSTGDDKWLERAHIVSEDVSRMARHSPDIMTGSSGTGLFHLALWHVSGDQLSLQRARSEAQALLETRTKGRPTWVIPPGHEGLSGEEHIGFSHGSAGIGYFLADCYLAGQDAELKSNCAEIADWIIAQGRPSLPDGSGLTWSILPDGQGEYSAHWCHGSAGISRFLTKAYDLNGDPRYLNAANRAARMLATGARWNGTTQCHGLAGNADVLLDVWRRTGGAYLDAARALGRNLVLYRTEQGWPSESHRVFSADFMVGQSGVGAAFIRLANPRLPHLVSTEAFESRQTSQRLGVSELKAYDASGGKHAQL